MIRHIFKQIWAERRQNSWILLELTAVFFFLLIFCDFFWIRIKNYHEPKGYDIENTFLLQLKQLDPIAPGYAPPEQNTQTPVEELTQLMDRIKQYPDVETLSVSMHATPYSMGGYWNRVNADTISTGSIRIRQVTPAYFDVFRIRSANGDPIRLETTDYRQGILTEDMARKLFGSAEKAIGQQVFLSDEETEKTTRIVAVSANYKRQDFHPYEGAYFEILRLHELKNQMVDICVRVRPGTASHFQQHFETEMGERLRVNNLYVSAVIPSEKLRDNVVGKMFRENILPMLYVTLFVLITVFLGVFGSFWLRTSQRQHEIGIRMAMGANKTTIQNWMLIESLLLISIVLLPALLVYINFLYADILDTWRLPFNLERVCIVFLSALLIILLIVTSGTLWPARRAANTQPIDALHDE